MLDVKVGLLFDYYGQFLTAKQRDVMHLYFENDCSLSEIAEELQVSRQAVHNTIIKSKKALYEYEDRLGLALRFSKTDEAIQKIREITDKLIAAAEEGGDNETITINRNELLSGLKDIKDTVSNIE